MEEPSLFSKILKKKPTLLSVLIIALSIFIAIFGYCLAPDSTPDANEQSPLIALQNPGFKVTMLKIPKRQNIEVVSWFSKIFSGAANDFNYVPIVDFKIQNDSVYVSKFGGIDPTNNNFLKGKPQRFHILEVAQKISSKNDSIIISGDGFNYYNTDNILTHISRSQVLSRLNAAQIQKTFLFGTDNFGRDIFSRLILGVRVSLFVGLIAVAISLTLGIFLGALAGYVGGSTDSIITLLINVVWSIPTILLVFAIILVFGRGIGIIFLAVGLTMWVDVARLVRGQVLALRNIPYIEAARSMGFSSARIIIKHILPNILGPVMVLAASNFASAILIESGLSFLGFGIQPPTPSWGTMLNENYGFAISGKVFLALAPAGAIVIMVLAFNLLGNGVRDALDIRIKE